MVTDRYSRSQELEVRGKILLYFELDYSDVEIVKTTPDINRTEEVNLAKNSYILDSTVITNSCYNYH